MVTKHDSIHPYLSVLLNVVEIVVDLVKNSLHAGF